MAGDQPRKPPSRALNSLLGGLLGGAGFVLSAGFAAFQGCDGPGFTSSAPPEIICGNPTLLTTVEVILVVLATLAPPVGVQLGLRGSFKTRFAIGMAVALFAVALQFLLASQQEHLTL